MFSKAKRFESGVSVKSQCSGSKKEIDVTKPKTKPGGVAPAAPATIKPKNKPCATPTSSVKSNCDAHSQCSSTKSVKLFATPKPVKLPTKGALNIKRTPLPTKSKKPENIQNDILKEQEVEIRNKDYTIAEYNKQIEELKSEIAHLHKQLKESIKSNEFTTINKQLAEIKLGDESNNTKSNQQSADDHIENLKLKISDLEQQCERLEQEVSSKQVELTSLEEIITIRDSLCKDLQEKLTNMEACLEETKQRLEMVKGHHALALEANESIRREYKAELESLKTKFEEEKSIIIAKSKADQENVKVKYNATVDAINPLLHGFFNQIWHAMQQGVKEQMMKERDYIVSELQNQLIIRDAEMKAKLEQIDESTHEKLRLCEIQFEERSRDLQEHCLQQQKRLQFLENETKDLKYSLNVTEDQNIKLQKEINLLNIEIDTLKTEKLMLERDAEQLKEESKKQLIEFENEKNKLTVEVDKTLKEKIKFETSLSVTRDIVQVLTLRLRESDNELESLENQLKSLTTTREVLENELASYKNMLNNTAMECTEYKEALVNILKSKAALAKEHTRIMEHNVSLIESLQNVEKEAYRELGSIKNELIDDVELIKKESNSQIQILREEVEKKRMLCELAKEHAGAATAAAEQSRVLLAQAAAEINRLESENQRLQHQIEDQQSLVVEVSLLRQENEELSMTIAKQSSILDKMKKDAEQNLALPKSPSLMRKTYKSGKENVQVAISPLRERNH